MRIFRYFKCHECGTKMVDHEIVHCDDKEVKVCCWCYSKIVKLIKNYEGGI